MFNFNKIIITLSVIFGVNITSFAHATDKNESSEMLEKYISYFDKRVEFDRTCFRPTVIKNSTDDYFKNYTDCLQEGLAVDAIDGVFGYVDQNGKTIIAHQYEHAFRFSDGIAMVVIKNENNDPVFGGKYGYIDKTGKFIINPIYILGKEHSEGLIGVLNENLKFGFIDKYGNTVLPFIYDFPYGFSLSDADIYTPFAYVFHDGVALVKLHSKWQFIDKQGNTVEYVNN